MLMEIMRTALAMFVGTVMMNSYVADSVPIRKEV